MRKSTFAKIAYEASWLEKFKNESMPSSLDLYVREIEDTLKMIRQVMEEDTQCTWEPEMLQEFLHCYSIEDGARLYDNVMKYSYNGCSSRGITLQQMLYEEVVDHNAVVSLWEKDEDNPHYSNQAWRGEFWKLPLKYKDRIGQIHGVVSDPDHPLESDDVHIELLPEMIVR